MHAPASGITRESILQRYRAPTTGTKSPTGPQAGAPISGSGSGLRTSPHGATPPSVKAAPPSRQRVGEMQTRSMNRLQKLASTDPVKAKPILDSGQAIATATTKATHLTAGMIAGSGTGWQHNSNFWDPGNTGSHHGSHDGSHDSHCHTTCSVCWSIGLWWGWGWWGWGYPGYWGYPYWGYAPYYYSPPPTYYSTVVYDNSAPPPAEPAAASGEGSIYTKQAPGSRASESGLAAPQGLSALPNAASDCLIRGDEAFRAARYVDAVHEYARAVELAPDRGVLHLVLSDGLLATGDYHYSAYALRRALELDPTLVDSVLDKHSFYGNATDCDEHIAALEKYVGEHPQDDDARLLLAANFLFSNRTLRAREVLDDPASAAVRETATGKVLAERIRKTLSETAPEAKPK
jgi:hypothetical protein